MKRSPEELAGLISAIDCIEAAPDKYTLLDALSSYLESYGVKHVTMGLIINPALMSDDVTQLGVSNFPPDFFDVWVKDNLIMQDPILAYAVRSKSAFEWSEAYVQASRFGRRVMDAGADVGLSEGLVVPVFAPEHPTGLVSLALEERLNDPTTKATMEIPIIHAFNRLLHFLEPNVMPAEVSLTLREIDILHYVAAGKTNWEIGKILGISVNTVKKTLQNILSKYQTSSRTHAVALAIRQGAILP